MKWLCDWIFPPRCVICTEVLALEERQGELCEGCRSKIPFIPKEICPHCGGQTEIAGFCEFCRKSFAFETACAAFPYETVRHAIHLFKYEGGKAIGEGLGRLLAQYLQEIHPQRLSETDVLLSVPLHPKKEKKRGFDQTQILCDQIRKATGIPMERLLERKRNTVAQSSLSSPEERRKNLKDAFAVTGAVEGKRILLVDDILTTGSTCNECAKVLLRSGAERVDVCCLAAAGLQIK